MVADFRQFYGIDLPVMDEPWEIEPGRFGILWESLPRESRTARRINPANEWGDTERMLRSIEFSQRVALWRESRDGRHNRNRPEPVEAPEERSERERKAARAKAEEKRIAAQLGFASDPMR